MNRILISSDEPDGHGRVRLSDHRAAHILRVLRLGAGATLRVGVVNGPHGTAVIESVAGEGVDVRCTLEREAPSPPRIDLLLALPRPKVMKRLWAPLASLGLGRIIVTNAARVERNYFDTHWLEPEAYRPLLLEGLQQSGDTWLPAVDVRREFRPLVEDALDALCPGTLRLVGDPAAAAPVRDVPALPGCRFLLAVGPEGGWTDFELDLLARHGFARVSAGGGALRSDVACMVLLALVRDRAQQSGSP